MVLLNIGGTDLHNPTTYSLQISDLDGAGTTRSLDGTLHRDRIRAGVVKIEASWECISYADMVTIRDAVEPASFTVQYFDGSSTLKTATMYAGDKTIESVSVTGSNLSEVDSRWNVKFNLIQY